MPRERRRFLVEYVQWFNQLDRRSAAIAGGKGANLGEMAQAGLPVLPGFVVTVQAYERFIQAAKIEPEIRRILANVDVEDPTGLSVTAEELQRLIEQAPMPDDVRTEVAVAYRQLVKVGEEDTEFVAVRSSATVEDAATASFAGMFRSFLNVHGTDAVLQGIRACWASLFTPRAIAYSARQRLLFDQHIAVIVQQMVNAEKSGVLFTVDPATGNPNHIVVEAAWGLGELVVQGDVRPDRYIVDKRGLRIVERVVSRKDFALIRTPEGANGRIALDDIKANERVLSDDEVRALAELAVRDENHYRAPQDAEWAIAGGKVYFVQTRPVTAVAPRTIAEMSAEGEVLVRGLGASPGVAAGPVRVLHAVTDGARLQQGEVLVTEMTSPDWVPVMRRAAAIVTDGGGMTSHAAIVSRELGIPCIVGTGRATRLLHDGDVVTVDAREGVIRRGTLVESAAPATAKGPAAGREPGLRIITAVPAAPVTATRIYVNLGEPEHAAEFARLPVDGVGLLRAEFMILSALGGRHPRQLLQEGRADEFVERMVSNLLVFTSSFAPRPVIYRSMDFRTNEFRGLQGGAQFEPEEANPMIGYRGCYRYTREPDLFQLELRILLRVREQFENLHLMIPFVRTRSEFATCKRLIDESGLTQSKSFQLWIMAEVPSVVYWLPDYAALGATGVSIGSNDLTQLMLGVDRDSDVMAPLFDERDPAVLDAIRRIVEASHQAGITCSICGQAPSVYPDYAEWLVRWGIDSISVTPDAVEQSRRNVAAAEQRILLEGARRAAVAVETTAGTVAPEVAAGAAAPVTTRPAAVAPARGTEFARAPAAGPDGHTGALRPVA
ncbi:MAG: phosphoenolpyruvate synthase [Chloroflexi bacterium]|nr:phosphoenolpyruvate synthase [Chloroflexota bacterium]